MSQRPHAAGIDAFTSGELRKSKFSGSLNKTRELSGGSSGYRSESRRPNTEATKYSVRGDIPPSKVVKTTIHYKKSSKSVDKNGEEIVNVEVKRISQLGYVPKLGAFTTIPFAFKVVYEDANGKTMTITNTNIR